MKAVVELVGSHGCYHQRKLFHVNQQEAFLGRLLDLAPALRIEDAAGKALQSSPRTGPLSYFLSPCAFGVLFVRYSRSE